jgi:AcrR family transcriptional regulator
MIELPTGLARPQAKAHPSMSYEPERPGARVRLLQATLEVIDEQGLERATTRRIADRAGANLQLIQYYFGSKAAMIEEARRFVVQQYQRRLDEAVSGADGLASGLRAGILFTWRMAVEQPAMVQPDLLLQYVRSTQPATDGTSPPDLMRARSTQIHAAQLIADVAERTGERLKVPAQRLALLMSAGLGGLIMEYRITGDQEHVSAAVETFADLMESLVEPTGGPRAAGG